MPDSIQPEPTTTDSLPLWNCHKQVRAAKITGILEAGLDAAANRLHTLTFDGFGLDVPIQYMHKHKPEVGGYFVAYADGHQSFSPAEAFEDGYSLAQNILEPEEAAATAPEHEAPAKHAKHKK